MKEEKVSRGWLKADALLDVEKCLRAGDSV